MPTNANLVLTGMPGAGKSTIGVLIAKILARPFIDTDLLIQTRTGRSLQHLIDSLGPERFCDIEEGVILSLAVNRHVIATGGSVVYRSGAMRHLRANGFVIYLKAGLDTLSARLTDIDHRGVVLPRQRGLKDLLDEREPLYQSYAHATIPCDGLDHNQVLAALIKALPETRKGQNFEHRTSK